jgi:hypothetical protein
MAVLIRRLVICLLVLALPAQGLAAATLAFCGPAHHAAGMSLPGAAAADPGQGHHDSHPGGGAGSAHAQHAQHAQQVDPAGHEPAAPADAGSQKCSACASCCSAGAIPSALPALPEPVFATLVFPAVASRVDPFAASGPDRPPRHLLA